MPVVNIDPGSSRQEGGRTLIVIGCLLLVYELIVMCWVGWDIRAGNYFIQAAMAVITVIAVGLVLWGWAKTRRVSI